MSAVEAWRDDASRELFEAILRLDSAGEASAFFRDLCTLGELHDMAQRWAVVRLLDGGMHYGEISRARRRSPASPSGCTTAKAAMPKPSSASAPQIPQPKPEKIPNDPPTPTGNPEQRPTG